MRFLTLFSILLFCQLSSAQLTSIKGFAPKYIGKEVHLYRYQDLITYTEEEIASTKVEADSTFALNFYFNTIEKLKIKVDNNFSYLYVQPGGKYEIYVPLKNKYEVENPSGYEVELAFRDLDSTDINYKILQYNQWEYSFLGENYETRSVEGVKFAQALDTLKINMEKYYQNDTSSYMKIFVKFRMAALDNLGFLGSRNDAEKFHHYLERSTVYYTNEPYMSYINVFFKDYFGRLPEEINNKIYDAVLRSSPSILFNEMGKDYRMKNLRLRELIMINALGEIYYNPDYPQTNVEVILDSLSKKTLFKANQIIAQDIHDKLTHLIPGSACPRYSLLDLAGNDWNTEMTKGKYKYIQFIDYKTAVGKKEMELLNPLNEKYKSEIAIITVFMNKENWSESEKEKLKKTYPWVLTIPKNETDLKHAFSLTKYPHYVLIDPDGLIVQAPALRPSPDGEYETIDKTFFYIHQAMMKK